MPEMTLERACEILNAAEYLGREWDVTPRHYSEGDGWEFEGHRPDGTGSMVLDVWTAIAVAERLEREASASLRSQVMSLADLADGWYDGDGKAYDADQLKAVADVLDRLAGIAGACVYPSPDGQIRVEWGDQRPVDDSIVIDPATLSTSWHLMDHTPGGMVMVGEVRREDPVSSFVPPVESRPQVGEATQRVMESLRDAIDGWEDRDWLCFNHECGFGEQVDRDVVVAALRECGMEVE